MYTTTNLITEINIFNKNIFITKIIIAAILSIIIIHTPIIISINDNLFKRLN